MMEITLTVPNNYSELSEKQLRFVAALLIVGVPEETIWTRCFIKFSGIKPIRSLQDKYFFSKKGLKALFSLSVEDVLSFSKNMDWITKSYICLKPLAKIGWFVPVMPLFENVRFLQYLEAENFYQAYLFTKDEKHLHMLMATLYGLPGKEYDNSKTEKRSNYFANRRKVEKFITIMWMIGVKEFFTNKFPDLFERSYVSEDGEEQSTVPDMYANIQNQMRLLTEGDITKREQVLQSMAWDALDEMNAKIREAKELKKIQNS